MRRPEYAVCYDTGRRFFSRNFILFVAVRPEGNAHRLGMAVSKKVGVAVRRNRVKRLVREWFRLVDLDTALSLDVARDGNPDGAHCASSRPKESTNGGAAESPIPGFLDIVVVARRGIDVKALHFEGVAQELTNTVRRVLKDPAGAERGSGQRRRTNKAAGRSGR